MGHSWKLSLLLAFAYGMAAAVSTLTEQEKMDFLVAHNDARSQVMPMPAVALLPLEWNNTLADYAKNHTDQCILGKSHGPYGENLLWMSSSGKQLTPADIVRIWVIERINYDYDSNTCWEGCGHYTQVVWRNSTTIGCDRSHTCDDGGIIYMCAYNPPGNFFGEWPY